MTNERLDTLAKAGVAIWLDDISRERLSEGGSQTALAEMRDSFNVVGVTSNPTIFQQAVASSDDYDQQLTDLAVRKVTVEEATRMITTYDVRWACDVMRPVFDSTSGLDGRVSIEVDPRLAGLTSPTVAEAKQLWWLVDRPNLFIKIPATRAGLPAITAVLAQGISVNVTLIFSLDRYRDVMDAWLSGLEQAHANGHDLSKIESVASFFVSRVDTEIDKRLDKIGGEALKLKGKAAVANAHLAYEAFLEVTKSARWVSLKANGANVQRPLWASTGTKNPDYSPTLYVDELVAPNTVNTMPEKTLRAVAAASTPLEADAITPKLEAAHATMEALKAAGVDYDDVVEVLEREGVEKFSASWQELLDGVKSALESHG